MGTGNKMKCKACGAEWLHLTGVGLNSSPEEIQQEIEHPGSVNNPEPVCPQCGSKDVEPLASVLWD